LGCTTDRSRAGMRKSLQGGTLKEF